MSSDKKSLAVTEGIAQLTKTVHCPVCMDYMAIPTVLPCFHTYCAECIEEVVKTSVKPSCPLCQKLFAKKDVTIASKSLQPIIVSIKRFVACYEGKQIVEDSRSGDDQIQVDKKKYHMERPDFKAGDLVHVAPRLWPGINKPGGAAWIQAVLDQGMGDVDDGVSYDCKYVLGGGIDLRVPAAYIRVANDLSEERESRSRRSKPQLSKIHHSPRTAGSTGSKRIRVDQNEDQVVPPVVSSQKREDAITSVSIAQEEEEIIPMGLLCSTLSADELAVVQQFCECFPTATVLDSYSGAVTHVVVRVERKGKGRSQVRILKNRTMKYLQGVLGHKWIVSHEWLEECIQQGCVVDETPFEVTRDSKADPASCGPRRSRGAGGGCAAPGLFDTGCHFIFAGPFCHPGPTIDNLSFLLTTGGGRVLGSTAALVTTVNASLDGGLRVRRKHAPPMNEVMVVVVATAEAGNDFCRQVFLSVCDVRKECAYDYGDFVDHLRGFVAVVLSDWIFDCISNYSFVEPLQLPCRFLVDIDRRNNSWQAHTCTST